MDRDSAFGAEPEQLRELLSFGLEEEGPPDEGTPTVSLDLLPTSDSRIGPYKLLGVLGEGGCGIVYLAEQERPVKRRVALKIIKPGMDTKQVIARFEAERQALALLDHPNIAHVHDAGTTEGGRPYFVMEYVKGVPIIEHCDRQKLTIEERLALFLEVCEAIHHAHQKGIIHRDIKPSNILVLIEGERATPKVIDFGIAKAVSQPLTERTLVTEQGQFVGTPEYMSPEQAELTVQDIDTRSDIYSLGVVLYELLTGVLPFDPKTLREGGPDQTRRVICQEEPKTPSTRLTALGEEAKTIAEGRRTDVASLARRLHRELEWIPLKAMRKDRTRRYRSASELADDIRNYLDGHPLIAGPETVTYRVQKFVQRHAGLVTMVLLVAVAILLALAVSTTMYIRAQRAQTNEAQLRRQAQAQAYASDISLAQQALAMDDLGRARRLLEAHRPAPGEVDLRGWEWRYLWQECQSDALGELCRYPSQVRSVAYSPDGNVLAVAGSVQEFVDIWDVPGRRRIATLQPKEGHLVAFSPRGDLLATTAGNQIRLWRTGTWDLVEPPLTLPAYVEVFRFSPDGKQLASLSYPDEVTVWKVDNWDVVRRIRGVRLGLLLGTLDFSPDGKALVIGGADGRLQVVDLASGNLNFDIPKAHPESITAVAWSPNGSIIASGSGWLGGPIRLWDAATGNNLGKLEGHTSWICELIFSLSPDGLRLYSAGGDQTIRIWDVGQGQCLATLRGSSDVVQGLARSPDGTTLASVCKDGVVAFWNALPRPEEEQPRLIPLGRGISLWPAFAPSSQVLAAPREGTVSLFDLATSKEIEPIPKLGDDVSTVAYSPDGTLLVSGSRRGRIRVWSCAERRALGELDGHKEPIVRLYFRADGTRLLSVDRKGNAIWWDALTWQPGRTFMVEFVWAWPGDVSPDDHLLAAAAMGAMRWLNAETGELLATTTGGHQGIPDGAAFSDDGSQVASVSPDGTVALWDPSSFRLITVFRGHMLGAHGVAFSPDGRRLATGSNGRDAVRLWDLSTHRELMTLSGQGSQFWFVAFSPDGRWLAACGREGRLHLWRAPSWEEIEAAENRTARIWDVATPDQVATR